MSIRRYRKKRNFEITTEPRGTLEQKDAHLFVIQKHAASHLHYDFRLEIHGVLKSWAVPKGPTLDASIKRLAIEVEDHPVEYGEFEGIIPEKQYGAGTVMIWDKGTWECDVEPYKAYQNGKINIRLFGQKLHGLWTLVKIKKQPNNFKNAWLLIKANDEYAQKHFDIVAELTNSALTGRSMQDIGKEIIPKAKKNKQLNKSNLPPTLQPELAYLVNQPPRGNEWLHEIKYDGYRLLCFIRDDKIQFMTRNGKDWTDRFLFLIPDIKQLKLNNSILDGELVAIKDGQMSFQALQGYLKGTQNHEILYFIFDVPYYNHYNLTQKPLITRKRYLEKIFKASDPHSKVKCSEFIQGHGLKVFKGACKKGLEGIMSKKMDSVYESHRSHNWVKSKCSKREEFIIGGYTKPKHSREAFGALLLGYYDDNHLIYCGKVGTGFTSKLLKEYLHMFLPYVAKKSPFWDNKLIEEIKNVTWLKPKFVGEVLFTEFTDDHLLRHPSFLGLREDKLAKEVNKPGLETIKMTHADKILYPKDGITKKDLMVYYDAIKDWILPYIVDRPISVLRCPLGYGNHCFFQKHPHKNFPKHVFSAALKSQKENYIYIQDERGLLSLIQANVLEIHPWGSKINSIEKPDLITFDLDPGPKVQWKTMIEVARLMHAELNALDLENFLKTTGSKGLHIVVPIQKKYEWPVIKEFAKLFSMYIAMLHPDILTTHMSKEARIHKIYIDYLRNTRGATSVAPYSTRCQEHPSVSTPLSWSELRTSISANAYTITNILSKLKRSRDPWKDFFKTQQTITKKLISHFKK